MNEVVVLTYSLAKQLNLRCQKVMEQSNSYVRLENDVGNVLYAIEG